MAADGQKVCSDEAHEVGEFLFLGSVKAATNSKFLERWKIARILVVDTTSSILWPNKFTYKRIKLDDAPTANLLEVLPEALDFLCEAQLRRAPCLVQCTRGISRSASVVVAFLMFFRRMSYAQAKSSVQQKRRIVYPNPGFQVQLEHLESLLAAAPAGHTGERLKWLRSAVPRGSLTEASSSFLVREALSRPMLEELNRARQLCQGTVTDNQALQRSCRSVGSFFELFRKYEAIPADHDLVEMAASVSGLLRDLVRGEAPAAAAEAPSARAIEALAEELSAWSTLAAKAFAEGNAASGDAGGGPGPKRRKVAP